MTEQWEYRYETHSNVDQYYDALMELSASWLGREGWELVDVLKFPDRIDAHGNVETYHVKGYFKRRKPGDSETVEITEDWPRTSCE